MSAVEENYEGLSALAFMAARSAKRRYPTSDLEDLIQAAFEWCLTHPRKLQNYLDDEDKRRGARMLTASMRNAAKKYAREERAASFGYELDDDAWYSKRMLKGDGNRPGLLHYAFDRGNWPKPPPSDGAGRGKGDPAEGNGWLTMMCDLSSALDKALSLDEYSLVYWHYGEGLSHEKVAVRHGSSATTVRRRIDRAVRRVQDYLGGEKPHEDPAEEGIEPEYVGTRRVISNAHARAITANQWE